MSDRYCEALYAWTNDRPGVRLGGNRATSGPRGDTHYKRRRNPPNQQPGLQLSPIHPNSPSHVQHSKPVQAADRQRIQQRSQPQTRP